MAKHIVFFATTTNTSGETINEGSQSDFASDRARYNRMNTYVKVTTLSGTSPTITVSVRENFGGNYVETAKSTALSSTGDYILCRDGSQPTGVTSVLQGPFPAQGAGADKRVVTTIGGTTSAVNASIYFIFFDNQ